MSTKFRTVITTAGAAKLAAATAPGGRKVNITTMAVGDGGGKLPVPDAGQTGLTGCASVPGHTVITKLLPILTVGRFILQVA